MAAPGVGYLRIAAIGPKTADQAKAQVPTSSKSGASTLIVDVRRTSGGSLDGGLALARLFVGQRHARACAKRKGAGARNDRRRDRATARSRCRPRCSSTPARRAPPSSSPSALVRQQARRADRRAHDRPRRRSRSSIKLPDGSGLWLTTTRYLTPDGEPLHEKGLEPTVAGRRARCRLRPAGADRRSDPREGARARRRRRKPRRPRNLLY